MTIQLCSYAAFMNHYAADMLMFEVSGETSNF